MVCHSCDCEKGAPGGDSKAEVPTTGSVSRPHVVLLSIVMDKGCGGGIWNSVQQQVSLGERTEVCTESSDLEPKIGGTSGSLATSGSDACMACFMHVLSSDCVRMCM